MKWLRRGLWVVKGALLIVCLALVVLWVRSYSREDRIGYVGTFESQEEVGERFRWLRSESGWVWAGITDVIRGAVAERERKMSAQAGGGSLPRWVRETWETNPEGMALYDYDAGRGPVRWNVMREKWKKEHTKSRYLRLRHWLATLVSGAWPLASLALAARRAVRRRRRARRGLCSSCGYDLRATADGSGGLLPRCPECGREQRAASTDMRR